MTVAVCGVCGARIPLRSDFELDGECGECGAENALVAEDAYDPEPLELICCDCRARCDGGPAGSGPVAGDHAGRYTVEDPCPFCSTPDGRGSSSRSRASSSRAGSPTPRWPVPQR